MEMMKRQAKAPKMVKMTSTADKVTIVVVEGFYKKLEMRNKNSSFRKNGL